MTDSSSVILFRHGHVHNPGELFYGRMPRFRLSERGREEARAAGRMAAGMDLAAIYSSPLLRARQTAQEIRAFHPDLPVRRSRHLAEINCAYDGRQNAEVDFRLGDVYTGADPSYEQPADIVQRTLKFFRLARTRHAGRSTAAVTHGDVIVFAMLWARGLALDPRQKVNLHALGFSGGYPATGSLTTFVFRTDSDRELPEISYRKP
jgi:broad specificity phosphatase PhoE